jgi:hypothetical protein
VDQFGHQLLDGYLRDGAFGHRQHLHMTWSYLRRGEPERVLSFLRHVADSHGESDKLNVTMTRFWVDVTAHALASEGTGADEFGRLLERAPHLLDRQLPFRHWSREAMFSPEARAGWVEPDLRPLPF